MTVYSQNTDESPSTVNKSKSVTLYKWCQTTSWSRLL